MKKLVVAFTILIFAVAVGGYVALGHLDRDSALRHETGKWAAIQDTNGDLIAVESTSTAVWDILIKLNLNGTRMWIGGTVERYDNKWGFRFKPESIVVAVIAAEGLQATIRFVSENLGYWLQLKRAYSLCRVVEIHN